MRTLFSVTSLLTLGLWNSACQQHDSTLQDSYVIDGKVWADGTVQASIIGPPTVVALVPIPAASNSNPPGETLDSYKLVGVFDSHEINQKLHDVALIDRHPNHPEQILSMTYRLCVSQKPMYGGTDFIISVQKIRDTPNPAEQCKNQLTAIGRSFVASGTTVGIMKLEKNISVAEITGGAKTGSWALTLTNISEISQRQRVYCGGNTEVNQGNPNQSPGQNSVTQGKGSGKSGGATTQAGGIGQAPTQGGSCNAPIPPAEFCNGDPLAPACRNSILSYPAGTAAAPVTAVSGIKPVDSITNVFQINSIVGEAGVLKFVSSSIPSTEGTSENRCENFFSAVARTSDNRVHRRCDLTYYPLPPEGGKLTCGVAVKIQPSAAVLDKVCEIQGNFEAATPELMSVRAFASY